MSSFWTIIIMSALITILSIFVFYQGFKAGYQVGGNEIFKAWDKCIKELEERER